MKTYLLIILTVVSFKAYSQSSVINSRVIGMGEPVIVIEGFTSCDSDWISLVQKLAIHYQFHLITISALNGNLEIDTPVLKQVKEELVGYIASQHLFRPVAIGQDLGALLALSIAGEHPYLFSKILCIDNFSLKSAGSYSYQSSEELLRNPAYKIAHVASIRSRETDIPIQYAIEKATIPLVDNENWAASIAQRLSQCDPETLHDIFKEMMKINPRNNFPRMDFPVLILASNPSSAPGFKREIETEYKSLPHKSVLIVPSMHLVAYNDPLWFREQIKNFLVNGLAN
jgi:pimeloyl-ACP methyl ester carboxylesterase